MKMAVTTLLLLFLWTESSLGYNLKRILGGHNCAGTERLHHVHLYKHHSTFPSQYVCGGSLVHAQLVLTAAKCYFPKDNKGWEIYVHVGVHGDGQQVTEIPVADVQRSVDNMKNTMGEITLLKLQSPAPEAIAPVGLPECNDGDPPPASLKTIQLAGHIISSSGFLGIQKDTESKNLQCVDMDVVPCPEPNLLCRTLKVDSLKTNICYKGVGKDAGKGDEGGGVVDKANNVLWGVHLEDKSTACGTPPRSINVCTHMKMIKKYISDLAA